MHRSCSGPAGSEADGLSAPTRLSTAVRLSAASLAVLLTESLAAANSPSLVAGAPIRIERCAIESRSVDPDPFNGFRSQLATGPSIGFSNRRSVASTDVRIAVRYQGTLVTIVERGIFAPGTRIERTSSDFSGVLPGSDSADCRVVAAKFSDGTLWPEP
jgi:hypothetical protein